MDSICSKCYFAGNVASDVLKTKGWIGCRKTLSIQQDYLNSGAWVDKSNEQIAAELYENITCEEVATGWVDNGPLNSPSGRQFNGVLMTKGTTRCEYFKENSN